MNLFDPETYAGLRRTLLDAETLPASCYTSPDFYAREVSEIFLKCWNLIGREDYVKAPGDYFTMCLAGVPLIILRGQDGNIRAFVNSCRHRGSRLLDGEGNCRLITCPYHAWSYETDGRVRGAMGMQETRDFDPAEYGLVTVKLESWAGFIFVNFDPESATLAAYLGDLSDHTWSYGFESMVTVGRKEFAVRANWKTYIENSLENFHLPTVHRRTIGGVKAIWTGIDGAPGNYVILHSKTDSSRAVLSGDKGFGPIPTLRGRAAEGAQYILVYPCTVIGADLDCMWFKQMVPDGPDTMRNIAAFCFTKAAVESPDFAEIVQNYLKRFDLVIGEDNFISEQQYKGLNQPFARAGRFSKLEPLVHTIDNWIIDRVVGRASRDG